MKEGEGAKNLKPSSSHPQPSTATSGKKKKGTRDFLYSQRKKGIQRLSRWSRDPAPPGRKSPRAALKTRLFGRGVHQSEAPRADAEKKSASKPESDLQHK